MNFKVRLQPSGREFDVNAGEKILDAALRQGLSLPYSCRGGTCGACKARVSEGTLDYGGGAPAALTPADGEAGCALLCQARPTSDLTIEVRELASGDIKIRRLPSRVAKREQLAPDVIRLYLKLPAGERLQFLAGQYIDILLKDGRHRSFSLANSPHNDEFLELHVRHVRGGTFSDHVFADMQEKELLRIEGPHGGFCLRDRSERPMLFVAGGTGFAPIKGILEHAFAAGVRRPMHFYWGARAQCDLYLEELPLRWQRSYDFFRYTPVLSDPAPQDRWHGRTGYVHEAVLADHRDLNAYDVYVAGPPAMVRAAHDGFIARGLPLGQFYSDPFEYSADARASGATPEELS